MKVFCTTKNGREVVYVQMQDIVHLYQSDLPMPASIYTKVFTGTTTVNSSNRSNFVKFYEEHEVKFFRDLEFVIDYNEVKDLTAEQLKEKGQKLAAKANELAEKWNKMSQKEREKNSNLLQEHENLRYMLGFLREIYALKQQQKQILFPKFV